MRLQFGLVLAAALLLTVGGARPATQTEIPWQLSASSAGAICNGTADDTAALQRAAATLEARGGGDLVLPIGTCVISTTLTIGTPGGDYSHINLVGHGEDSSLIAYRGPMNRPAIFADHVAYYHWRGFSVTGRSAADFQTHGTSVGILIGSAQGAGGTMSTGGTFEHVAASGFQAGLVLGESAPSVAAASEFTCRACRFTYNDVGVTWSGYNTLNLRFYDVDLTANTRGMQIGGDGKFGGAAGDGPTVIGGSTALNTECDFCVGNAFGVIRLESLRAEPQGRFLKGSVWLPMTVRLSTVNPTRMDDHVVIDVSPGGGRIEIAQNDLHGSVRVAGTGGGGGDLSTSIVMWGNSVIEEAGSLPLIVPPSGAANGLHLKFWGNVARESRMPLPDTEGIYGGGTPATWMPWTMSDRSITGPVNGAPSLMQVRSLALGTAVAGRNLRDQVTFRSAQDAAFTFRRTVPVSTVAGSRTIAFAAGAISAIDVGKTIVLPAATDNCGYSPRSPRPYDAVDAVITSLVDATHAMVASRGWTYSAARCQQSITRTLPSVAAVVGEDEPDANYFLDGIVCDANEVVSFSRKTPAGIGFVSSNPASTATCTFSIKR